MLYMIIETFKAQPECIYERFRKRGRMMPEGLTYVNSWVVEDFKTCYQIVETKDRALINKWIKHWSDLVEFEVIPVMTSSEASVKLGFD